MADYKLTHYTTYQKPDVQYISGQHEAIIEFAESCKEMAELSTYYKVTLHALDYLDDKYKLVGKLEKYRKS